MTFFNFPENQPIEHAMVSKAMEQAQVKVEGFNFDTRKHLLEFDDVLNKQREIVYGQRRKIMEMAEHDPQALENFLADQTAKVVATQLSLVSFEKNLSPETVGKVVEGYFQLSEKEKEQLAKLTVSELEANFSENLEQLLKSKRERFGSELYNEGVNILYLSTIDHYFTEHLTHIESLREGISLRGYAQLDPLNEYKKESYSIFNNMLNSIRNDFFRRVAHMEIEPRELKEIVAEREEGVAMHEEVTALKPKEPPVAAKETTTPSSKKLGRNDPCWCGSGKKFKKCHYPRMS